MEIESENCYNGIKRKKPLVLDWEDLLPTASGDEDHPPEFVVTSNRKSKVGCSGEDAQENQKEYLELLMKTDHEISEYITRHTKTMSILSESLPDKGQRLKTALRRHEDELQRRKKLPPESQMEEKSDHENSESIARIRKNISILSERFPDKGEKLKAVLRRHEDELQRRKKLQSENQKEDLELQTKSDHEINEFIARYRKNISILSVRLPDKGLRLKAALQRHEDELQRRKKLQSEKGHNECEETILVSDDIDGGASCGKENGDQKSLSSLAFAKLFSQMLEGDKDSRTVNACQGGKVKPNSQLEHMEANPSRPHHPSSDHCPTEPSSPTQPARSQHDDKDFISWRSQMRSEIHCLRSDFQDLRSDFIAYQEAGDIRFTQLQDVFAEIRYELRRQASNGFDR